LKCWSGKRIVTSPSSVTDVLGVHARERFDALTVDQRRAVIRSIMRPQLMPGKKGERGLNVARVRPGWLALTHTAATG
jgi:hypothetical protein